MWVGGHISVGIEGPEIVTCAADFYLAALDGHAACAADTAIGADAELPGSDFKRTALNSHRIRIDARVAGVDLKRATAGNGETRLVRSFLPYAVGIILSDGVLALDHQPDRCYIAAIVINIAAYRCVLQRQRRAVPLDVVVGLVAANRDCAVRVRCGVGAGCAAAVQCLVADHDFGFGHIKRYFEIFVCGEVGTCGDIACTARIISAQDIPGRARHGGNGAAAYGLSPARGRDAVAAIDNGLSLAGLYAIAAASRADRASADGNVAAAGGDAAAAALCLDCAVADGNVAALGADAAAVADGHVASGRYVAVSAHGDVPYGAYAEAAAVGRYFAVSAPCDAAPGPYSKAAAAGIYGAVPAHFDVAFGAYAEAVVTGLDASGRYFGKASRDDIASGVDAIAVAAAACSSCAVGIDLTGIRVGVSYGDAAHGIDAIAAAAGCGNGGAAAVVGIYVAAGDFNAAGINAAA